MNEGVKVIFVPNQKLLPNLGSTQEIKRQRYWKDTAKSSSVGTKSPLLVKAICYVNLSGTTSLGLMTMVSIDYQQTLKSHLSTLNASSWISYVFNNFSDMFIVDLANTLWSHWQSEESEILHIGSSSEFLKKVSQIKKTNSL